MNNIFLNNLFYAVLSSVFAIFFCVLGGISILIPWVTQVRTDVVQAILEGSLAIFVFGFVFLFIGITILVNIILSCRKRFYHLRSGKKAVTIDESFFDQYLEEYWKGIFPHCEVSYKLIIKKNKLHIVADLPYMPLDQQKLLLERIRHDLRDLFTQIFGYRGEFFLSASFQNQ